MVAFDQMGLGGRAKLRFICEKDTAARNLIMSHRSPGVVYDDITTRRVEDMPVCDIYAAGFPCQPWSAAGLREGTHDRHGRGTIFSHIHDYIRVKAPKCFLLENVKGMTMATHREAFTQLLQSLRAGMENKYIVSWRVVNTADFGLPQNRPRLYIIGIRRAVLKERPGLPPFLWPRPVGCVPLASVLETGQVKRPQPRAGTTAAKNLLLLQRRLKKSNAVSDPVALDIFASRARTMVGKVPCLTRTRAGSGGYWITGVNGLLTTREMLRLQGLPETFIQIAEAAAVSERQLRQMIGNAMSVNVLVTILSRLLPALGLC
jgi:DNA (cytosine-5)-methyltransferase 1